jgi:hypothetical protein
VTSRLEQLGFFAYADAARLDHVRREVERDPSSGVFSLDTRRFFFADAEDLAEGGVDELLRELEPVLREAGVPALTVEEALVEDHYDVTVNGRRYPILSEPEIMSNQIWGYAAARTAMLVNDLLMRAGSSERAYGVLGGNDFGIFLLTPELRNEVAKAIGSPADEPYEMTDEPPDFGYPA